MRRGAELCRACRDAVNAERVRERRKAIALYWGLGMTLREIGDALGTTKETVGAEIARMRKLGWDIPRRYTVRSRS